MAKRQVKKVQAGPVTKFEANQHFGTNGNGVLIVSDSYGTVWRVEVNSGTATEVKFER